MKIKKGDLVQVITGKDKGKQGKVIAAFPANDRVLVEGVNRVKKHTKAGQTAGGSQTGGIVITERRSTSATFSWLWRRTARRSSPASVSASTTRATRSALPSGRVRTSDGYHSASQDEVPRGHRGQAA